MYKEVEPVEEVPGWGTKAEVTLKDEHGGIVHVIKDDGCYLMVINSTLTDKVFTVAPWIFPEAFEALRKLPPLR